MSGYNNITHTAEINSNKEKIKKIVPIVAYRAKSNGNIYFPSLLGTKDICIGIEGGKLRAFSPITLADTLYEPVYQGEEEFTIKIK